MCNLSEESASLGFPQDIRAIGQKIVYNKATNVTPFGVTRGLPEGNLTKILLSNKHTCSLIRIRTLDLKEKRRYWRRHVFIEGGENRCIVDVLRTLRKTWE
jgi:hypothetical protein